MLVADWGTTNLRLHLCTEDGAIIRTVASPQGIRQLGPDDYSLHLQQQLEALEVTSADRMFVCGMAGARNAWRETPYCEVPIRLADLQEQLTPLPEPFHGYLLPGGKAHCANGTIDVMRGEEIQAFGALEYFGTREMVYCLPGTHSKWLRVCDGAIEAFATFPTGDLFYGLTQTFVGGGSDEPRSEEAFKRGFEAAIDPGYGFLHAIFSARTRMLDGTLKQGQVASYLSGLLVGQEISEALPFWKKVGEVGLIGSGPLCAAYRQGLEYFSIRRHELSSDLATCAGVAALNRRLRESEV